MGSEARRCEHCGAEHGQRRLTRSKPGRRYCSRACYRAAAPSRFWSHVDKAGPVPAHRPDLGPCWLWLGARRERGHGHCLIQGRFQPAHCVAYDELVGPVPDGMELDHLCRTPACVNPAHLEPVTGQENRRRGIRVGVFNSSPDTCPYGHPLDGENLYVDPQGSRYCRICIRAAGSRHRERDRERYNALQRAAYQRRRAAGAKR